MRLSGILREAYRDIVSGTARVAVLVVALGLALVALIAVDAVAVAQQSASADAYRTAGASTRILAAEGRVDPQACDRLNTIQGVSAAGALRASTERIALLVLPSSPVPAWEVSPGFPAVVAPAGARASGVLMPLELAGELGTAGGATVATDLGSMRIASTYDYPADGRRAGLGYAILTPTAAPTPFDECWVVAWPEISNLRTVLLATVLPESARGGESPRISQLNGSLGEEFAGASAFLDRSTRAVVPVAGLAAFGVGYLSVRLRRLQIASALHAGVVRADAVAVQLVQAAAWVGAACVIATGTAVVAAPQLMPDEPFALLRAVLGVPLAGFAGALVGAAVATLATRERHLLRYFRER